MASKYNMINQCYKKEKKYKEGQQINTQEGSNWHEKKRDEQIN